MFTSLPSRQAVSLWDKRGAWGRGARLSRFRSCVVVESFLGATWLVLSLALLFVLPPVYTLLKAMKLGCFV